MWDRQFSGALIGLDAPIAAVRAWYTHHRKTKALLIYGPTGSGKTAVVRKIIPGAYIAEPEAFNGPVSATQVPVFSHFECGGGEDTLPEYVSPGQVIEMTEPPPRGSKIAAHAIFVSTVGCGPTWKQLREFVAAVGGVEAAKVVELVGSGVGGDSAKVVDVRSELLNIEFSLINPVAGAVGGGGRADVAGSKVKSRRMAELARGAVVCGGDDRGAFDMYGTQTPPLEYEATINFQSWVDAAGLDMFDPDAEEMLDELYTQFIKYSRNTPVPPTKPPVPYLDARPRRGGGWSIDPTVPTPTSTPQVAAAVVDPIAGLVGRLWRDPSRWEVEWDRTGRRLGVADRRRLLAADKLDAAAGDVAAKALFNRWRKFVQAQPGPELEMSL